MGLVLGLFASLFLMVLEAAIGIFILCMRVFFGLVFPDTGCGAPAKEEASRG